MKRLIAIAAAAVGLATFALVGTGASDDGGDAYLVRAIFRSAFSLVPGEDVKVAGVRVGQIKEMEVTEDQQAAVVLEITEPGFQDFRKDAECTIRPQSLIGEKFVECTPTQPRTAGVAPAAPLDTIREGDGAGQRLLPVSNTSRPVDLDLLNNITRLPYRERLTIILNEFGAGLAGRGEDLKTVIRTADPALKQTDRVLDILAKQNRVLADLATDSDQILAPLARDRAKVADFIEQANTTAQATAAKREALEANIQRLPETLRQLRPTMQRLGELSDQAAPVLGDLGDVAPQVNRFIQELGPFSQAATPALTSLGKALVPGRTALNASKPIIADLRDLGRTGKPLGQDLKQLLLSFKSTGGVERLLDYAFYQVAAVNGFDSIGHYLRAQLIVNTCSTYATTPDLSCTANFIDTNSASSSRSARAALAAGKSGQRDPVLAMTDAVLRGMSADEVLGLMGKKGAKGAKTTSGGRSTGSGDALQLPPALLPGGGSGEGASGGSGSGSTSTTPAAPAPSSSGDQDDAGALLDYLLGGGGER